MTELAIDKSYPFSHTHRDAKIAATYFHAITELYPHHMTLPVHDIILVHLVITKLGNARRKVRRDALQLLCLLKSHTGEQEAWRRLGFGCDSALESNYEKIQLAISERLADAHAKDCYAFFDEVRSFYRPTISRHFLIYFRLFSTSFFEHQMVPRLATASTRDVRQAFAFVVPWLRKMDFHKAYSENSLPSSCSPFASSPSSTTSTLPSTVITGSGAPSSSTVSTTSSGAQTGGEDGAGDVGGKYKDDDDGTSIAPFALFSLLSHVLITPVARVVRIVVGTPLSTANSSFDTLPAFHTPNLVRTIKSLLMVTYRHGQAHPIQVEQLWATLAERRSNVPVLIRLLFEIGSQQVRFLAICTSLDHMFVPNG